MKKLLASLLILGVFFFSPLSAFAFTPLPIARNGSAIGTSSGTASATLTYNNVSGNLLVVFELQANAVDRHLNCNYNGVPMFYIGNSQTGTGASRIDAYWLPNPATGSHTVTCNTTVAVTQQIWALSYTGASVIAEPQAFSRTGVTLATALSNTIPVLQTGAWIVAAGISRSAMSSSVGTGAITEISNDPNQAGAIFDSNGPVSPGNAVSYGFSGAGSNELTLFGIVIGPPNTVVYSNGGAIKSKGGQIVIK